MLRQSELHRAAPPLQWATDQSLVKLPKFWQLLGSGWNVKRTCVQSDSDKKKNSTKVKPEKYQIKTSHRTAKCADEKRNLRSKNKKRSLLDVEALYYDIIFSLLKCCYSSRTAAKSDLKQGYSTMTFKNSDHVKLLIEKWNYQKRHTFPFDFSFSSNKFSLEKNDNRAHTFLKTWCVKSKQKSHKIIL